MKCDNGEIEVFLCPEEESLGGQQGSDPRTHPTNTYTEEDATDTESESASPVKSESGSHRYHPQRLGAPPPSPPPRLDLDEESRSSDIGQIRNVLISASEDFGPVGKQLQLQTLDQDHGKTTKMTVVSGTTGVFCYFLCAVFFVLLDSLIE